MPLAIPVVNVAASDTFGIWVQRTNDVITALNSNTVQLDATSNGMLTTGNGQVNGTLSATVFATPTLRGGNVAFEANLTITSNTSMNSWLAVTGFATFSNTLSVTGSTTLANTLNVTGAATFSATANVGANVQLSTSQLYIGNATVYSTITQTSANIGLLNARSAATLANTLGVTGAVTLANTLDVTGAATFTLSANVGANVQLTTSQLKIGNSTVFTAANSTTINVQNISVVTNGTVGGTLGVTGAVTLSNTLSTAGLATLNSANVLNDARLSGTTTAIGTATFANTVAITGAATFSNTISLGSNVVFTNARLTVGNSTVNSFINSTAISSGNVNATFLLATDAQVTANLTVQGSIVINGTTEINGTSILLNANGSVDANAFVTIRRPVTNANVSIKWNEVSDRWELTNNGTNFYQIWTEGNDGVGSGLDADLLDGQTGAYYSNATNLTGTVASARIAGSYTGITGVGTITTGTWNGTAISTAYISGLAASATTDTTNAGNITSGVLPSARLSGSYTGITGVGTLTAGTWNATTIAQNRGGTGVTTATNGQLLIGNGTGFALTTITGGSNINVTNGVGTITIAAPAKGADQYVQFNDGGTNTNATAGFTFNKFSNTLAVSNTFVVPTLYYINAAVGGSTDYTAQGPVMYFSGAAGAHRYIRMRSGSSPRFDFGINDIAETGSNAGSNLFINRFNDAGGFIDSPFSIDRNTGRVVAGNNMFVSTSFQAGTTGYFGSDLTTAGNFQVNGVMNVYGVGAPSRIGYHSIQGDNLKLGTYATGNRWSYIDFHSDDTYTNFSACIRREPGPNAATYFGHRGTGPLKMLAYEAASIALATSNADRLVVDSAGTVSIYSGWLGANNLLLQGQGGHCYVRPTNSGGWLYLGANNQNYFTIQASGWAELRRDINSRQSFNVYNGAVGGVASADVTVVTGTPNAYGQFLVIENSGDPYSAITFGDGVNNSYLMTKAQWIFRTAGVDRMYINNSNVTVTGNFYAGGEIASTSDIAFKEQINYLTNASVRGLQKIRKLKPASYVMKADEDKRTKYGVIAQDLEKVLPELVYGEEGKKSVGYLNIIALLIDGMQELDQEVQNLKAKLASV